MATLYEISEDMRALDALIEEHGGDVTDPLVEAAVDAWLTELQTNLEAKADGYCSYIRECEARAAARKEEAERLMMGAKAFTNRATSLKERLKLFMEANSIPKVTGRRYTVAVQGNGGVKPLRVDDAKLQETWRKTITTIVNDNERIREALEAGLNVPGAELLPRGTWLAIK